MLGVMPHADIMACLRHCIGCEVPDLVMQWWECHLCYSKVHAPQREEHHRCTCWGHLSVATTSEASVVVVKCTPVVVASNTSKIVLWYQLPIPCTQNFPPLKRMIYTGIVFSATTMPSGGSVPGTAMKYHVLQICRINVITYSR